MFDDALYSVIDMLEKDNWLRFKQLEFKSESSQEEIPHNYLSLKGKKLSLSHSYSPTGSNDDLNFTQTRSVYSDNQQKHRKGNKLLHFFSKSPQKQKN
jgi:hypothetical protein